MSTRCHIVVRGSKCEPSVNWEYIYHHYDGYPDGVGSEIGEAFEKTLKANGSGRKYSSDDIVKIITGIDYEYEVDDGFHLDEEYVYVVTIDDDQEGVTVTCYHTLPFSYNAGSTTFNIDEGFEFIYHKTYRSDESTETTEKYSIARLFKKELSEIKTVDLINMLRAISDELFLRELK